MILNKDYNLLMRHRDYCKPQIRHRNLIKWVFICLLLAFLATFVLISCSYASDHIIINNKLNIKRLCEAIGKAENSKTHPYGIMVKYKHTTPQQACINTIKHRLREYNTKHVNGDFIDYLALTYAPRGATNDPKDLNKNWAKNVKYFYYKKGKI